MILFLRKKMGMRKLNNKMLLLLVFIGASFSCGGCFAHPPSDSDLTKVVALGVRRAVSMHESDVNQVMISILSAEKPSLTSEALVALVDELFATNRSIMITPELHEKLISVRDDLSPQGQAACVILLNVFDVYE